MTTANGATIGTTQLDAGPRYRAGLRASAPAICAGSVVAAGLTIRLVRAWSGISSLLVHYVPDDAFYYFQIARNIVHGRNVTFDGETLTNGFHPLWLVVLLPISAVTDDRILAVHLGLTVGALFGAGTIVLLYAIVRDVGGSVRAALLAAAVYAVHPYVVSESVNGLETSVTVFMVALTTWLFLHVMRERPAFARGPHILLGVALGATAMARTDTIFTLALVLIAVIWRAPSPRRREALAVVGAPWVIWNLVTFGTVVQISGVAGSAFDREAYFATNSHALGGQIWHGIDLARITFTQRLMHVYLVPRQYSGTPAFAAGVVALGAIVVASARFEGARRKRLLLLLVPAAGAALTLLFHSAIRWHVREYYFGPVGFFIFAFGGIGVAYAEDAARAVAQRVRPNAGGPAIDRTTAAAVATLYAAVVVIVAVLYGPQTRGDWELQFPGQVNNLEAARWLNANTAPDARAGAFNAGIYGYFTERTLINLDGVVNQGAYRALYDGCRVKDYLRDKEIRYVVDQPQVLVFATCGSDPNVTFSKLVTIGVRYPGLFGIQPEIWSVQYPGQ